VGGSSVAVGVARAICQPIKPTTQHPEPCTRKATNPQL